MEPRQEDQTRGACTALTFPTHAAVQLINRLTFYPPPSLIVSGIESEGQAMADSGVGQGFGFDLRGRTVLVTGASAGIGRRFATILGQSGARVVLAARRAEVLAEAVYELKSRNIEAASVAMDVADEASTIAAYDAAEAAFGPVDTVVANAGLSAVGRAIDLPIEEFDKVVSVNLRGTFLTVREGAKRMIAHGSEQSGRGRIVIVSSITDRQISPGLAPYSATKAGVTQMGRVLARDWAGKGINVNVISPGYMHTDLTEGLAESRTGKALIAKFARPRFMDTDALDSTLLYLCSDVASQVTGSVFTIDDGQTLS